MLKGRRFPPGGLPDRKKQVACWLKDEKFQLTRLPRAAEARWSWLFLTRVFGGYVRESGLWQRSPATVRMASWPPGEVAELDFGRLGVLIDATTGKKQVVWALVVVLPYSRHSFVWPLLRQTLEESIAGLEAAWRFFGGVAKRQHGQSEALKPQRILVRPS